ncbi:MAG: 50S ribosomal protein L11 methyltransferase [Kiritimatiellae bacterium]|nr:50S ribosomal protein L11 methyltransferase [Kiritimatiellia bacterium]
MTFVSCSIPEQFVNPLFEVFDGGDFALSSYRDIEEPLTEMRVYLADPARAGDAERCLRDAMRVVGVDAPVAVGELADEDWRFSYRRHFKTEPIGRRLVIVPEWELADWKGDGSTPPRETVVMDPGLAFGTGRHETTKACLQYIDELAGEMTRGDASFLDMGCGSGILGIAAAKLGFSPVLGFDVDREAVAVATENAERNGAQASFFHFALGRGQTPPGGAVRYDVVAANILGPLLVRFADEVSSAVGSRLIVSGILSELYPDVLAAYEVRGLREVSRRTLGEWTTGLLARG